MQVFHVCIMLYYVHILVFFVQNLRILKVDPERDLLYVKGAVPGNAGGFLRIVDAVKGPFYPSAPPMPTFLDLDFKWDGKQLIAPEPEKDKHEPKIPDELV